MARQAVDEAISKSFTLKDFDRLMNEMGYRCSFDPNRKYWTIIGKGWKRPKRLYKLGEDYTNEKILERIRENSYAVKFSKFAEPQRQVTVYRLKGSLKGAKKIGGLRGLYLHYCYRLGILPKNRKQNYARLHYLLKDDLMKMDAITNETTVLFSTHVVEDLAATCTQLAIMKKGSFLYSGSVSGLLENANGCVWNCTVQNAEEARLLEANYSISSKQYVENGIHMKVLSKGKPNENCVLDKDITLEDAYIYLTNS